MNTILVFNVGSSSVKYAVFQNEKCVIQENFECIKTEKQRQKVVDDIVISLSKNNLKPTQIGHRIVHGGTISHTTKIDPIIRKKLDIM